MKSQVNPPAQRRERLIPMRSTGLARDYRLELEPTQTRFIGAPNGVLGVAGGPWSRFGSVGATK